MLALILPVTACLHDGGTATEVDGLMCVDLCATIGQPPYTEADALCMSDPMVLWTDKVAKKLDELCL